MTHGPLAERPALASSAPPWASSGLFRPLSAYSGPSSLFRPLPASIAAPVWPRPPPSLAHAGSPPATPSLAPLPAIRTSRYTRACARWLRQRRGRAPLRPGGPMRRRNGPLTGAPGASLGAAPGFSPGASPRACCCAPCTARPSTPALASEAPFANSPCAALHLTPALVRASLSAPSLTHSAHSRSGPRHHSQPTPIWRPLPPPPIPPFFPGGCGCRLGP